MLDLRSMFDYWESAGVFEIFLPFILVFSLVFAILEKVQMFGTGKKGIHSVIALALAILVANNDYIREVLHRFLPNVAFFMVVVLAVIMLISTMMGQGKFLTNGTWAVVIAIAFVVWALVAENVGDLYELPYWIDWLTNITDQTLYSILGIGAFIVVGYLVLKSFGGGQAEQAEPAKKA